jgi:hypothetical protein
MTTFEITLLSLLISSVILNVVLFLHSNRFKKIFNSLFTEIDKLQKLLSSSTSNLDSLLKENKNLWNQVESLKKTKTNLLTVNQGDKVVCKQSLTAKKSNHSFEVLYECNVVEATEKRLKLSAFDFKSDDDWANKNKQSVINYFQDYWVERSECDIIMDQQHIRDTKLNDLLNGLEDSN